MSVTDQRLEEIEARMQRVPKGPWVTQYVLPSRHGGGGYWTVHDAEDKFVAETDEPFGDTRRIVAFIADAPEDIAYLLSLVRTQAAEIERLKAGQRKAVKEGMKEGTRALAIWKDGRPLVGVLAEPLDTVLREIDDEVGYAAVVVSAALARLEEQT